MVSEPKICAAITAETIEEATRMINRAKRDGANLLEFRADYLKKVERKKIVEIAGSTTLPMILTVRSWREGGRFRGSESERIKLLLDNAGRFEYVDIELETPKVLKIADIVKDGGAVLIVSHHDYAYTPTVNLMLHIIDQEKSVGADVCKLVTTANDIVDNIRCFEAVRWSSRRLTNIVCFVMGELGILSRVLSPLFGARFTYASVTKGKASAPGQLTIEEMRNAYRALGF